MLKRTLRAIFGNFRLKAWALIISLAVWSYASSQVTDEATVRATVSITAPPNYELLHQSETAARVTVVGPRALVSRVRGDLAQNYLQFAYNLTEQDLTDGLATLTIERDWLRPRLPEQEFVQIKLRDITPPQVQVFGSPIRERVLPVKVEGSIEPAEGFRLAGPPSASPPRVTVRGPAIAVDGLESVATRPLALPAVSTRVQQPVSLQDEVEVLLDNGVTITVPLEVSPPSVVANVDVTREEEREETFAGVPVLLRATPGFPYEVELSEDTVSVVVRASATNLRKLKPELIKAYVALETLAEEEIEVGGSRPYTERVHVELPADVSYSEARARPERLTVRLKNPAG